MSSTDRNYQSSNGTNNSGNRARFRSALDRAVKLLDKPAAHAPMSNRLPVLKALAKRSSLVGHPFSVPMQGDKPANLTAVRKALKGYVGAIPAAYRPAAS